MMVVAMITLRRFMCIFPFRICTHTNVPQGPLLRSCLHIFVRQLGASRLKGHQQIVDPAKSKLYEALFFGAFLPFLRAFERAIAIACFRLLTRPPLPLFAV